jgi:hypothetical protein
MTVIRAAWRRVIGRPVVTPIVVGLLAGAIGINSTVFAVLSGVAFKRLLYPLADRIVDVRLARRGREYCSRETIPAALSMTGSGRCNRSVHGARCAEYRAG